MAFPKAYVHRHERLPPRIVNTAEEEAALESGLWMQIAPQAVSPTVPEWPQLWYDVNLPPRLILSQDQADQLGSNWRRQDLSPLFPEVPGVDITPTEETFLATGGPGSFDVRITSPGQSGTWTASKDADATWITITAPTEPQSVDGEVLYTVALNGGPQRTANIYVNGKTHTVTQEGPGGA